MFCACLFKTQTHIFTQSPNIISQARAKHKTVQCDVHLKGDAGTARPQADELHHPCDELAVQPGYGWVEPWQQNTSISG